MISLKERLSGNINYLKRDANQLEQGLEMDELELLKSFSNNMLDVKR